MSEQVEFNLEIVVWRDHSEEVTLELKTERARNAERGENIPNGGNSLSKGPEVEKSFLFSGIERPVRLEKQAERKV